MSGSCFHCGEPLPSAETFTALIANQAQFFCCAGCRAASQLIDGAGLGQFYHIRDQQSPQALADNDSVNAVDLAEVQAEFVRRDGADAEAELVVDGMRCSACAWLIEHLLLQQAGVKSAVVNLAAQRLLLRWQPDLLPLSQLLLLLRRLGYQAIPFLPELEEQQYRQQSQTLLIQLGIAAIASMQVMMFGIGLWYGAFADMEADYEHFLRWVSLIFSIPVITYSALPFHLGALRGLLSGRPGMDLPVSIALLLAFGASVIATLNGGPHVYYEAVTMFVFFLLTGRLLEHRARRRAAEHTANLRRSMPLMARRIDADGQIQDVAVASLKPGQQLLIAPGATIPADALIESGESELDESLLTGESLPLAKGPGAVVYAGSINGMSPLQIRVTRQKHDSLLATIIRSQTQALAERPRWAMLADRIASQFVVAQLLLTALTYLAWHYWLDADRAFEVALALLVATCPCALALATPAALSSAIARLSQLGVLVRRSAVFEPLSKVSAVVFDKTGTLSHGQLSLLSIEPLADVDNAQILALAMAIEQNSEHPVARALCALATSTHFIATERTNHPGLGVSATIAGQRYALGRPDWFSVAELPPAVGLSVILYRAEQPLARLQFSDALRPEAVALCQQLAQQQLQLIVASGDPSPAAAAILAPLPLTAIHLGQTPQAKQQLIAALQQQGERVLAIGDGINDAPVLAQADCSLAMGAGTDLAKQSADVVLVANRLDGVALLLRIGRRATLTARQNLGWALLYNLIVIPLAMAGWITPWFAALGMSLSSVVVLANASRLLRAL